MSGSVLLGDGNHELDLTGDFLSYYLGPPADVESGLRMRGKFKFLILPDRSNDAIVKISHIT